MSIAKSPQLTDRLYTGSHEKTLGLTAKEKLLNRIRDNEHEICITENRLRNLQAENYNLLNRLESMETR